MTNGEIVSGSFTSISDGNYTFKVRSNPWPGSVTVSLAANAATNSDGLGTTPGTMTVTYIEEKVTQYANMVTHWTFDEPGGNRIKDYGPLYPNGHDIEKIGGNSRTTPVNSVEVFRSMQTRQPIFLLPHTLRPMPWLHQSLLVQWCFRLMGQEYYYF